MKKTFLPLLVLLVVGVFVLTGCGSSNTVQKNTATTNNTNNTNAATTGNAITIKNFTFSPATLTVQKGTIVIWTNEDAGQHQIKSTTFNSNPFGQGQSFSATFDTVGTFDYSCAIHPTMTGKIIVQ